MVDSGAEVAGSGEGKAKSDGEAKEWLDPRRWRRSGRRRSGLLERPPTRLLLLRLWVVQPLHLRKQHFERFADVLVVLRRRLDVCRAELLGESLTLGGRDGSARQLSRCHVNGITYRSPAKSDFCATTTHGTFSRPAKSRILSCTVWHISNDCRDVMENTSM